MIQQKETDINSIYGRVPPQAIDVEQAVLGALMLESEAYSKIETILSDSSFYKHEHGIIFNVVKSLHKAEKPIDLMTVTNELKNTGKLEQVGGVMYLMKLTERVSTAAHIEFHSRIIKQKFIQREIIRISSEIQLQAYDDTQDVDDLLSFMTSEVDSLNDGIGGSDEGRTSHEIAKNAMKEIIEDYEKAKNNKLVGIDTGFYELNRMTGGWRSPNFVILAARPGVGKTSLMLHFAITAAKAGHWVNIYGYEMLSEDLFRIVLSGEADINRSKLRDGRLEQMDWDKINRAIGILENLPIIWYDKSDIKSNRIKTNTKKNVKAGKCDIVFADYLQIIPPEDDKNARELQISKISRTLKSITTSCKIPVISLAQLNRSIESRGKGTKPMLSDLRESGSLEQDADMVIFPFRDENEELLLSVSKHRRGRCFDIPIKVNEEMTKFYDDYSRYDESDIPPNVNQLTPNHNFYEQEKAPF